jgi:hypothetical protein
MACAAGQLGDLVICPIIAAQQMESFPRFKKDARSIGIRPTARSRFGRRKQRLPEING